MCVAAAIAGSAAAGLAGSAMSSSASRDAARSQSDSAKYSADLQDAQWQQTQQNLKPYLDLGNSAINPLLPTMGYLQGANGDWTQDKTNYLMQNFSAPTAAEAQATPGYQFTLDQGLKAVQNSASARGLGTSGAAMKGAASYATGLADSTYNDVFNRALQTFNTNYGAAANRVNRLNTLVGNGQNAAATNGSLGANAMSSIGDTLMSGANAAAAGRVGSANALASGLNGLGGNALVYGMMTNNAAGGGGASGAQSYPVTDYYAGATGTPIA